MNKAFLGKNVGKSLRLRPDPVHIADSGAHVVPADDWKVVSYANAIVTLSHLASGATVSIGDDNVLEYRTDAQRGDQHGYLLLKAHLVVRGLAVEVFPTLRPGEPMLLPPGGLLSEVYVDISLDCHGWKNSLLNLLGDEFPQEESGGDVWDLLETHAPKYSVVNYERYKMLFIQGSTVVRVRFDRALQLFGHALPYDFQAELVRGARQLQTEVRGFVAIPQILAEVPNFANPDALFQGRFLGTIHVLKFIARDADRRRTELIPPP